jgi:hypothetical protein
VEMTAAVTALISALPNTDWFCGPDTCWAGSSCEGSKAMGIEMELLLTAVKCVGRVGSGDVAVAGGSGGGG